MMLTRRDLDIINYLEEFRIASTTTLTAFFFPSLRSCQMRLKTLTVNGNIKRARLTMNHDYIYYVKKPGNYMHDLLVTEFYRCLSERCKILNFVSEKSIGKIRPDSIFAIEYEGKQRLGLLEVEISHKGFDYEKYEEFYKTAAYKEFFPVMPAVYVVCRSAKLPKSSQVKYVAIKTDMSDFRL
jgi:hypothetical protein